MKYEKIPLALSDQADLLIRRGMIGDAGIIADRLKVVSYYRLSGYWYPFRKMDSQDHHSRSDEFEKNTFFDVVWERYLFDRRLRLLVMDAIERIEVAVRSQLSYHHAQKYGAFGYAADIQSMSGFSSVERDKFNQDRKTEKEKSKEIFVQHFKSKYGDCHDHLPVWMAVEIMTFGAVLTFYRGCDIEIRRTIAQMYGIHESVFDTWLHALNTVRNICAHHGRLWNREIGVKPKIPLKITTWHDPVEIDNRRVFGVLTVCKWMMDRITFQSHWAKRVRELVRQYPHPRIPIREMGFPDAWERCPIWFADETA